MNTTLAKPKCVKVRPDTVERFEMIRKAHRWTNSETVSALTDHYLESHQDEFAIGDHAVTPVASCDGNAGQSIEGNDAGNPSLQLKYYHESETNQPQNRGGVS